MTESSRRSSLIDEFGDLDQDLSPFAKKLRRRDDLRKQIQSWYAEEGGNQTFIAAGDRWGVSIGEKAHKREFKPGCMRRLATFLGALFFKVCRVNLEDFDAHVPIGERARFVVESQSGYRKIEAFPKSQAKAA